MINTDNKILKKLLERLFASLINGPSLNCRPHSSRQRIDLVQLAKLNDASPEQILRELLGPDAQTKVSAKVEAPVNRGGSARRFGGAGRPAPDRGDSSGKAPSSASGGESPSEDTDADEKLSPAERAAQQAYADQQAVFGKLRSIAEDARTYENDTGVHVLQIGFPLLSLPPGSAGRLGLSRRIMAPLAFISLSMTVKGGPTPSVVLECRNEGADLVVPNLALLSWLEQQTGQKIGELENDEAGTKPWAEICSIAKRVCELVQVDLPAAFSGETMPEDFSLAAAPRSDETARGPRGKAAGVPESPAGGSSTSSAIEPLAPRDAAAATGAPAHAPDSANDLGTANPVSPSDAALDHDVRTPSPGTPGEGGGEGSVAGWNHVSDSQDAPSDETTSRDTAHGRTAESTHANLAAGDHPAAESTHSSLAADDQTAGDSHGDSTGLQNPHPTLSRSTGRGTEETADSHLDPSKTRVIAAAVVGLYPMANQGLLRDMQAMAGGEATVGPIESFLKVGVSLEAAPAAAAEGEPAVEKRTRNFAEERLVTIADPCQARAVRLARTSRGLVVHGPPGTGKSQTIANVIGDHLARGERVLFVCEKRTALDVVMNRLEGMGLSSLCGIVHDPQRDQRELYKSIREQVDNLADLKSDASAEGKLGKIDAELQKLHGELTEYHAALMKRPDKDSLSFHELMGRWLELSAKDLKPAGMTRVMGDRTQSRAEPAEAVSDAESEAESEDATTEKDDSSIAFVEDTTDGLSDDATLAPSPGTPGECGDEGSAAATSQAPDSKGTPAVPPASGALTGTGGDAASKSAADTSGRQNPHPTLSRSTGRGTDSPAAGRVEFDTKLLEAAAHGAVDEHAHALSDLFDRSAKVGYVANPWKSAAGMTLDEFLTTPADELRTIVAGLRTASESVDATIDPATPPIPAGADLTMLALARVRAAGELERVRDTVSAELRATWALADVKKIAATAHKLGEAAPHEAKIEGSPLDTELLAITRDALPSLGQIAEQTAALEAYVASTKSLFGFLAFGKKSAAAKVLAKFGLQPSAEKASRVANFLTALKARLLAKDILSQIAPGSVTAALPEDELLLATLREHHALLGFLATTNADANLADVRDLIRAAVAETDAPAEFTRGLRATTARVQAMGPLQTALGADHAATGVADSSVPPASDARPANASATSVAASSSASATSRSGSSASRHKSPASKMFSASTCEQFIVGAREGKPIAPRAAALVARFDSLENVLRIIDGLAALPAELRPSAEQLVTQNVNGAAGLVVMRKAADANEILRRLKANRLLMTADSQKLQSSFTRYQQLDQQKKQLTRAAVLHRWASKQRDRLLAATGSRLNGLGADLRRRLTIRGERAMRLRQVIQVGQSIDGGDPLYDLRPVWMASPETVAQLFPRQALFDVVIFDEASQCRLEEALPVLLRAKRVVIAGDPKQLPPTRFFESAVAVSDETELETDQQLFEHQQGEIEDLLAAALNIEIEECYLDVHYRSRNSALIEFSNEQFYHSRLQAIPGHPKNRARFAPLTLYSVNGVYDKRANAAEAEKVCQIVRDLLKRASPPSIGIACFNVTQRDMILVKLEELADADLEFGRSLSAARDRRSASSFEGLFVKNLENVQGDERDHIIISTTYGPDPKGKFYRRFGPIGTAGGGRRLNVLVTRARDEVHLVTSIPSTVYRNLPPIPAGETPGGAWLLFAYLVYAEQLAAVYEQNYQLMERVQATHEPVVTVLPTRFPSTFSEQFAGRLFGEQNLGSDVHWGNDGFCVDVALRHPEQADAVTIGVLCDMNRFEQAADPVEWEVFRTAALESQGWVFNRLWTPHFFRDHTGVTAAVVNEAETVAAKTDDPDALRTVSE